ncbi:MAG: response regulator [Deltaproteobacteria bacterium]|nr:response regulator [Deltaproteobacteria bacterium]
MSVTEPLRAGKAALVLLSGPRAEQRVVVDQVLIIGSESSCDVHLPDERVSRHHAKIYPTSGGLYISDLDSAQGTWVNGCRVRDRLLAIGDQIGVGDANLLQVELADRDYQNKPSAIGRLAADVAHDVNNMLAAILNNVSSIERGAERDACLREIRRVAEHGSVLTERLLRQAGERPDSPSPPQPAPPLRRRPEAAASAVLIVDDDEMVLRSTARLVRSMGFSVHTARSGEQAAELFRQRSTEIAAVILDMVMPGGYGGPETFAALRKVDPDVFVIVHTGYAERERLRQMELLGARAVLRKPLDATQLADLLAAATVSATG